MVRVAFVGFMLSVFAPLYGGEAQYQEILKRSEKILKEQPSHYVARFNRGYAHYKQGNYQKALEDFKKCYALADDFSKKSIIRYNMGNSFFMLKKLKKALLQYRLGLILDNNDPDLRYNYTVTKMLLEQQKKNKKNKQNKKQNKKNKKNKDKQQQGKQGKPQKGKQRKKPVKGQMSKKDALRLLRAMDEQERKKMKRKQVRIRGVKKGKDW